MKQHSFSPGAGRCCSVHSFLSKQLRAAILSHQSYSAEATEHWNMGKAGFSAQKSFLSLLFLPGLRQMYVPSSSWSREGAQTFGSRAPQQLIFHHPGGFSIYLCRSFLNLPAHYPSIISVYSSLYFMDKCTEGVLWLWPAHPSHFSGSIISSGYFQGHIHSLMINQVFSGTCPDLSYRQLVDHMKTKRPLLSVNYLFSQGYC